MFHPELIWNCGDQCDLSAACNLNGLFENDNSTNSSRGNCLFFFWSSKALSFLLVFDSNVDNTGWETSALNEPCFDRPNPEPQLQPYLPRPAGPYSTAISISSIPASSAETADFTLNPPIVNYGSSGDIVAAPRLTPFQAPSVVQEATQNNQPEATESGILIPPNTLSTHLQPGDEQAISPHTSKHGRAEKYFCTYSDCVRSRLGSGFYRKDHLDQHLRGPHKHNLVPRLRLNSAGASRARNCNSTPTSETTGAFAPPRKRKRGTEGDVGEQREDELSEELAEERRLRLLTEQENLQLRQKIENYEGRMQKYEERLDRMMALIEQHKGDERRWHFRTASRPPICAESLCLFLGLPILLGMVWNATVESIVLEEDSVLAYNGTERNVLALIPVQSSHRLRLLS